jgi:hypothetical protein
MATFNQLGMVIAQSPTMQARVRLALSISAASVYAETFTASAATAAANAVLHFASTTGIAAGNPVFDLTTAGVIPSGATVLSTTATTVTISANVTGAGVAIGDSISFVSGHVARAAFAHSITTGSFDLLGATFAVLGNTTISAEANINTQPDFGIPDSDVQFAVNSLWNLLAGA